MIWFSGTTEKLLTILNQTIKIRKGVKVAGDDHMSIV
jgi:hypothetical protein